MREQGYTALPFTGGTVGLHDLVVGGLMFVGGGVLIFTAHRLFKTRPKLGVAVDIAGVTLTGKGGKILMERLTT